jgi:hypothetical protein
MVKVCFDWSVFHWENPEIEALNMAIGALHQGRVWKYLEITGKEDILIDSVYIERVTTVTEEAKESKPPPGLTILNLDETRTIGAGRDLLEISVQIFCNINQVRYNIKFFVGMIITPNIKSIESVEIELLQKMPKGTSITEASKLPDYSKPRIKLP